MSPVASRRERPAKPALSREWIVAETIKIMRTEGLEKVTMRRVARALDTGPASLYVYVANVAELHAAVLDDLVGSLEPGAGNWRTRLKTLLAGYAAVLFEYPGLARSALVLRPTGKNSIRFYDQILGLLLEGGVPGDQAAWGVDLLLLYVTAHAAEHSAPTSADVRTTPEDGADLGTMSRAMHEADPDAAPHVAAHADMLVSGTPAQRVEWAIDSLLNGIAATRTPMRAAAPTRSR